MQIQDLKKGLQYIYEESFVRYRSVVLSKDILLDTVRIIVLEPMDSKENALVLFGQEKIVSSHALVRRYYYSLRNKYHTEVCNVSLLSNEAVCTLVGIIGGNKKDIASISYIFRLSDPNYLEQTILFSVSICPDDLVHLVSAMYDNGSIAFSKRIQTRNTVNLTLEGRTLVTEGMYTYYSYQFKLSDSINLKNREYLFCVMPNIHNNDIDGSHRY